MTIVKGATYDCAIMPLKFWSNDKHCTFSLRKLRCRKHCFRWLCLTKGQRNCDATVNTDYRAAIRLKSPLQYSIGVALP